MGRTIGRRVADITQQARGRVPLKYEFEIIPFFCGEIPDGIQNVAFAWERGSKLFVTEAEPVNPATHAVFWKYYLRQSATIYKENNEFLPKNYIFKIQSVKSKENGKEVRKTIGKLRVNLSEYCTNQLDGEPRDVFLKLKPVGKIKLSIKATWQSDAVFDPDALTEVTSSSAHFDNDQDLSNCNPSDYEDDEDGGQLGRDSVGNGDRFSGSRDSGGGGGHGHSHDPDDVFHEEDLGDPGHANSISNNNNNT
eukprot:CAMPEP_0175066454 /NCGR_PEP_ID=MMETSP0052_2-20121109/16520_1 /TAXON_ID=51329 ORGANISM="Polytomella parva, Strain SAG 63-3" /NCGR_SAMPLE_ID=MMETSP0052_2 /ASSEMBLY_ACC=CAM_ASM_000194 /LENGTH=250 /DNA_ID=CAMNT_0016333163 /DNA_START=52 /DNA_END=800 /DNA_ORIENTATION=+